MISAWQQERDHPIGIHPPSLHFLREFDFPAQPSRVAGVETDNYNDLAGFFNGPAYFRHDPVATAQLMDIAPDAQAAGFQSQRQIPGERGIGGCVADNDRGGSHRKIPEWKGKVKMMNSLAQND